MHNICQHIWSLNWLDRDSQGLQQSLDEQQYTEFIHFLRAPFMLEYIELQAQSKYPGSLYINSYFAFYTTTMSTILFSVVTLK